MIKKLTIQDVILLLEGKMCKCIDNNFHDRDITYTINAPRIGDEDWRLYFTDGNDLMDVNWGGRKDDISSFDTESNILYLDGHSSTMELQILSKVLIYPTETDEVLI